ncbi:MAG: RNA polymerase sigma factor [Polyangiaceae bacterium]
MASDEVPPLPGAFATDEESPRGGALGTEGPDARLRRLVDTYFGVVWRTLRFHGVPEANADDAAQQVFCVLSRRLGDVRPGTEQAFLLSTAYRVASDVRHAASRRPAGSEEELDSLEAPIPPPDVLLDQARARALLQEVLEEIPPDVRRVFVMVEIEEFALGEVAKIIGAPIGTVSSRLRRGRQIFEAILKRRRAVEGRGRKGERT